MFKEELCFNSTNFNVKHQSLYSGTCLMGASIGLTVNQDSSRSRGDTRTSESFLFRKRENIYKKKRAS